MLSFIVFILAAQI